MPGDGQFFHIDNLSLVMMALVGFVGLSVASFSSRYLKGDRKQGLFYLNLTALITSVFVMVSADHLVLLFISWMISNLFLTRLILHKQEWQAARESSRLALRNFALGLVLLGIAFLSLYHVTGTLSVQAILSSPINQSWAIFSAALIFAAAMTQSALWPFHRWLTSSGNAPTPVSAIMHAGLVNGGGFLLARFAPMFLEQPSVLNIIFITGIVTALLGTLWKLMQSDIKRMLACSTMGQMGFMIAQCGLGLFPAAVAHLCWHGLFKAYLFLSSGSAAQEKRLDLEGAPKAGDFLLALICGAGGAYIFTLVSGKNIAAGDTTLFLIILAMLAGTQFALPMIRHNSLAKLPLVLAGTMVTGAVYGLSVYAVELALSPLNIAEPQALNVLHLIAMIALGGAWLAILFGSYHAGSKPYPDWVLKFYVRMLNASQPHPATVTTHRNQYKF